MNTSDFSSCFLCVFVEANLFLAQLVKLLCVALDGDLKARLVLIVVLIARLHNLLVMVGVLDVNITCDLV